MLKKILLTACFFTAVSTIAAKEFRYFIDNGDEKVVVVMNHRVQEGRNVVESRYSRILGAEDADIPVDKMDVVVGIYVEYDVVDGVYLWEKQDFEEDTDVIMARNAEVITIKGRHRGKKVDYEIKVDEYPWYQNVGDHAKYIVNANKQIHYWFIKPDDFSPIFMYAENKGLEDFEYKYMGRTGKAWKIQARPDGFGSLFFSYDYWARSPDYAFLKVKGEGPFGIGGTNAELIFEK